MRTTRSRSHRLAAATVGVIALALLPGIASASHGLATLSPSSFEIDDDANLANDDGASWTDWADLAHPNGPEVRATDLATGQNDNSYKGGVKEDTACPGEVTGSIPNNKSDLLTFHTYEEPGTGGHPGFLNLAWSRVSDPSGTTLMDFEFNQSSTKCSNSPNVVRTEGDLLVEYAITQGGARANVLYREWTGSAWGPANDASAPRPECGGAPCAVGTINQTAIPAGASDGLGAKAARTFGEAQIDLDLIFNDDECVSFGSAMIKSRSSDAFSSQLKDFIAPVPLDLQNCANVIIRKQTDPDEDPNETLFTYEKTFGTDPASDNTFQLTDDGVQDYEDTVLFGEGYTVDETALGDGYDFDNVNCDASEGVTPTIDGTLVTFDLDNADDVLDCTYTNKARGTLIVEKVTSSGQGPFDFTSSTLDPAAWTLTTTGAGAANGDDRTFTDLDPGTYDAAETVPTGWTLASATCDDGSPVGAIDVDAGETVTCTFVNDRQTGAIRIVKTRKHAAATPTTQPHAGVTFEITGGDLPAAGITRQTDATGVICVDGLTISQFVGPYSVRENPIPAGYQVVSANPQGNLTVVPSSCDADTSDDATATFENMPLTNIAVSVDSQVVGGTASVLRCDWDGNGSLETVINTGAGGDGSNNQNNLLPGTYTCEIYVDP